MTMNEFSTTELTRLQATQAVAMQDTCIVQTCTETADAYGAPLATYADGSAQTCGFKPKGGKERTRADGTLLVTDAEVRLALTATVAVKDRVKITKRYGTTLTTALVFEVIGLPQRGPSGLVIELKAIT